MAKPTAPVRLRFVAIALEVAIAVEVVAIVVQVVAIMAGNPPNFA